MSTACSFHACGTPKARCSQERRMCETLLLANPYTHTLRPQRSRASTICQGTARPQVRFRHHFWCAIRLVCPAIFVDHGLLLEFLRGRLCGRPGYVRGPHHGRMHILTVSFFNRRLLGLHVIFIGYGLMHFGSLVWRRVGDMVRHAYKFGGWFKRIARGVPWAGSVTGGEACGYPCSEKEGFTHPWFWRAPCFWGAKNAETAR